MRINRWLLVAVIFGGSAAPAFAAETGRASEPVFVLQIVLLIVVGRLLGEFMQRIGQPAVMGQLAAGIVLGPSVLGGLWPAAETALFPPVAAQQSMLQGVAALGVLMLLLLSGMETDLKLVRRIGRPAIIVSLAGIAVPFLIGFAVTESVPDHFLPDPDARFVTALFIGTTLSISSVKIVAMVIRELGFQRRNIGQILLASAILDDTLAWILLGIISSLAVSGLVDLGGVLRSTVGTGLFLLLSFTIGRQIVFRLIRFANDRFISEAAVISAILALMGALALATDAIGVHTVLGAFVAGMLIGNSPILTRKIDDQLRGLITSLFMPVFFGLSGLNADLRVLADPTILLLTLGIVVIASVGKFAGAFLGGRLAGMSYRECLTLGCGMNARGSTEVIVATVGLSVGVLDHTLYTMIVTMALVTTLAMPPMLRWALSRLPFTEKEQERMRREEFAAQSFVGTLERLLIAVDESPSGALASRLAGLIAGSRGLPATVLHLNSPPGKVQSGGDEPEPARPGADLVSAAEASASKASETEGGTPAPVPLTLLLHDSPPSEAIAAEAANGYDLLVVGLNRAILSSGRSSRRLSNAADAFDGPLAIVDARGVHVDDPLHRRFNILVPVSGTDVSRRALEFAVTVARATDGRVTALYVANERRAQRRGFNLRRLGSRGDQAIVLKDAASLADEYNARLRTAVSSGTTPEDSILRYADRARYDLIVLGVNKRPGDHLYFGELAEAVLARAEQSLLLVVA